MERVGIDFGEEKEKEGKVGKGGDKGKVDKSGKRKEEKGKGGKVGKRGDKGKVDESGKRGKRTEEKE